MEKWRTIGDFEWRNNVVNLGYNRITLVAVLSPDYRVQEEVPGRRLLKLSKQEMMVTCTRVEALQAVRSGSIPDIFGR